MHPILTPESSFYSSFIYNPFSDTEKLGGRYPQYAIYLSNCRIHWKSFLNCELTPLLIYQPEYNIYLEFFYSLTLGLENAVKILCSIVT